MPTTCAHCGHTCSTSLSASTTSGIQTGPTSHQAETAHRDPGHDAGLGASLRDTIKVAVLADQRLRDRTVSHRLHKDGRGDSLIPGLQNILRLRN
eukprot:EC716616.1.p3 GENE.EC716616.1~~EC716616.1.p3  ORF type:complete len:95 (-),score=0.97 EC716616.1:204-488(-)